MLLLHVEVVVQFFLVLAIYVICRGPFCLCLILIDTRPQPTHAEGFKRLIKHLIKKTNPFTNWRNHKQNSMASFSTIDTVCNSVLWNIYWNSLIFYKGRHFEMVHFCGPSWWDLLHWRMFSFPTSNAGHFVPQPWWPSGKASSGVGGWWIKQDWDHYQPIKREQQDDIGGFKWDGFFSGVEIWC